MLCGDGREFKKQIPNIGTVGEDFYSFLENGSAGFFRQCSWMGKKYNCDKIFRPIITDEGLCMTFNMLNDEQIYRNNVFPPPINRKLPNDYAFEEWSADHGYGEEAGVESYPRRALLSGSSNALIVNMEVALDDLDYACSNFQGFQVVLHKAIRFPTVTEHYFRVPLSKSVIVAISPAQIVTSDDVKYYSPRKRKCFLQGEKTLMYFKNYTQYNCKLECLTNYTLDVCGCVSFYMPREKYTPICGNGNLTCISFVKRYMDIAGLRRSLDKETNIRNFSKILSCDCLPMCTMVEYNTEITEIDYDWYKKYESIGNKTERDEKYSSSQLVIYFKSGHYIPCVRHELYGHLDFLANVGGLLGLFVGFSLISLLEILYFVSVRIICNMKLYQHWYGE
ncbi:unnamed protein product [Phaedon cochleariae]|uniref:Uncharacterized protein n=1 Tax=Phaedon cochleariae TaxID=80249 RepID=A0A9P0GJR3_PHACE|nr:unnamed protein product [Phaedon cochleariae]